MPTGITLAAAATVISCAARDGPVSSGSGGRSPQGCEVSPRPLEPPPRSSLFTVPQTHRPPATVLPGVSVHAFPQPLPRMFFYQIQGRLTPAHLLSSFRSLLKGASLKSPWLTILHPVAPAPRTRRPHNGSGNRRSVLRWFPRSLQGRSPRCHLQELGSRWLRSLCMWRTSPLFMAVFPAPRPGPAT